VLITANVNTKAGITNGTRGVITRWVTNPDLEGDDLEEAVDFSEETKNANEHEHEQQQQQSRQDDAAAQAAKRVKYATSTQQEIDGKRPPMQLPMVRLLDGREIMIAPFKWRNSEYDQNGDIIAQAVAEQLPLIMAYAITSHRSQGMTLDYVEVDLANTFSPAQAYVAISRARTLRGLRVVNFREEYVFAHPDAIDFYTRLDRPAAHRTE
jgi:ATP-dependent exoDNAse (exonuclease V) alpha subunit